MGSFVWLYSQWLAHSRHFMLAKLNGPVPLTAPSMAIPILTPPPNKLIWSGTSTQMCGCQRHWKVLPTLITFPAQPRLTKAQGLAPDSNHSPKFSTGAGEQQVTGEPEGGEVGAGTSPCPLTHTTPFPVLGQVLGRKSRDLASGPNSAPTHWMTVDD